MMMSLKMERSEPLLLRFIERGTQPLKDGKKKTDRDGKTEGNNATSATNKKRSGAVAPALPPGR